MLVRPYYDTVEVENGVFLSRSHEKWSLEVMESHGKVMEKSWKSVGTLVLFYKCLNKFSYQKIYLPLS